MRGEDLSLDEKTAGTGVGEPRVHAIGRRSPRQRSWLLASVKRRKMFISGGLSGLVLEFKAARGLGTLLGRGALI